MSEVYQNNTFSVGVIDGWEFCERPASVAFFRTRDGRGAINISKMEKREGGDADAESLLALFSRESARLRRIDPWQSGVDVAFGECERDGRLWRYWVFWRRPRAVFVSYNCRLENRDDEELAEVEATVRSINMI